MKVIVVLDDAHNVVIGVLIHAVHHVVQLADQSRILLLNEQARRMDFKQLAHDEKFLDFTNAE